MLEKSFDAILNLADGYADILECIMSVVDAGEVLPDNQDANLAKALMVLSMIQDKPDLRRLVVLNLATIVAMDEFAKGKDFSLAMNEARDQAQSLFADPEMSSRLLEFYNQKRDKLDELIAKIKERGAPGDPEELAAMLHQCVASMRS